MSLDRRIVSILYFNGYFDINSVENFARIDDNYYEAIINGELKKLKIPGKEYFEEEIKKEKETKKVKTIFEQKSIEEELEAVDASTSGHVTVTNFSLNSVVNELYEEIKPINEEKIKKEKSSVKKEVIPEIKEEPVKKEVVTPEIKEEKKPVEKKKNTRKLKIVESKKDDDDFIDSL